MNTERSTFIMRARLFARDAFLTRSSTFKELRNRLNQTNLIISCLDVPF